MSTEIERNTILQKMEFCKKEIKTDKRNAIICLIIGIISLFSILIYNITMPMLPYIDPGEFFDSAKNMAIYNYQHGFKLVLVLIQFIGAPLFLALGISLAMCHSEEKQEYAELEEELKSCEEIEEKDESERK